MILLTGNELLKAINKISTPKSKNIFKMKIHLKKLSIKPVICISANLFFLAALCSGAAFANERESTYSIYSHGFKVGEVKTYCTPLARNNKKYYEFQADIHINANFIFSSFRLDKKEEALVNQEGTFYYKRTSTQNGKTQQVEGHLDKDGFVLSIEENGEKNLKVIGKNEYDYTTLDCPEITLGPEDKEKTFRILDFEHLAVVRRSYKWVKSEDITVDGKHIQCNVVEFKDPYNKCRRWVKQDELGLLIIRQDGKGREGSYSTHLTSLAINPRDTQVVNYSGNVIKTFQ